MINKNIPMIKMQTINNCITAKDLIEVIPPHCICDNIDTFNELCKRYREANLTFVYDKNDYSVKS